MPSHWQSHVFDPLSIPDFRSSRSFFLPHPAFSTSPRVSLKCFNQSASKRRISLVATWDQSGAPEHHPKWWKSAKISQSKFKVWSNMAIVIGKWSFGFFLKTLRHWSLRAPHFWRWACGFAWKRNGGLTRINRCVSSTKAHDRGFSRARNTSRPTFKSNCKNIGYGSNDWPKITQKWPTCATWATAASLPCLGIHGCQPTETQWSRLWSWARTCSDASIVGLTKHEIFTNKNTTCQLGGIVYNRKMEIQPSIYEGLTYYRVSFVGFVSRKPWILRPNFLGVPEDPQVTRRLVLGHQIIDLIIMVQERLAKLVLKTLEFLSRLSQSCENVTPNSRLARKTMLPSHCFCFNNSVKMPPALRWVVKFVLISGGSLETEFSPFVLVVST